MFVCTHFIWYLYGAEGRVGYKSNNQQKVPPANKQLFFLERCVCVFVCVVRVLSSYLKEAAVRVSVIEV